MMREICAALLMLLSMGVCRVSGAEPQGIADLLKSLEDADTRWFAVRDLEEMGLDAAPAVPQLIGLLDNRDEAVCAAAADALGVIGKDATAAIPKLVERLGEGELPRISTELRVTDVGVHASWALGKMGKDAVEFLMPCLTDKRSAVRSNAACALHFIGPDAKDAVMPLIGRLKDRDWLVRQCAAEALGRIGSKPDQTIPSLVASLKDRNLNVRRAAVASLGAIRPTTPAAVEALTSALKDHEGNVQHKAAEALAGLGTEAVPAVPALADALKSRELYVEGHPGVFLPVAGTVARALGAIGPPAKSAIPALLDLIRDTKGTFGGILAQDNREARGEAAIAVARIDPQSDDVVLVLGRSLRNDEWIRGQVAIALALIGPKARSTVPTLVHFADPNDLSQETLICACAAVAIEPDDPAAVRRMLGCFSPESIALNDDEWSLLRTALARAGSASRPAIPALIEKLEDAYGDREFVVRTLAIFGPEADSAVPALLDLLTRRWEHPRQEAIEALQQIASEKSAALLAALKSPDVNVRAGAVEVLARYPSALHLVTEALDDPSARVRLAALVSLAKVESNAAPAIPQIKKLLQSDSRTLREAAAITLQKVEQHATPQ